MKFMQQMFMNKPQGYSSTDHVQLADQEENADTKRKKDRSDKYRLDKKQKQLNMFSNDAIPNNSNEDHAPVKKEKKKKEKEKEKTLSSNDGGGSNYIPNAAPIKHKKDPA